MDDSGLLNESQITILQKHKGSDMRCMHMEVVWQLYERRIGVYDDRYLKTAEQRRLGDYG